LGAGENVQLVPFDIDLDEVYLINMLGLTNVVDRVYFDGL
jgi:hypothetical protein